MKTTRFEHVGHVALSNMYLLYNCCMPRNGVHHVSNIDICAIWGGQGAGCRWVSLRRLAPSMLRCMSLVKWNTMKRLNSSTLHALLGIIKGWYRHDTCKLRFLLPVWKPKIFNQMVAEAVVHLLCIVSFRPKLGRISTPSSTHKNITHVKFCCNKKWWCSDRPCLTCEWTEPRQWWQAMPSVPSLLLPSFQILPTRILMPSMFFLVLHSDQWWWRFGFRFSFKCFLLHHDALWNFP